MKKILILTASVGNGHVSVAHAIAEAIQTHAHEKVNVEIIDFIHTFKSFFTTATKKIYLSFLKVSPKIWSAIFAHTSEQEWSIKLFNLLNTSVAQKKFLTLLMERSPSLIVSTHPIWDLLLKKTRQEYGKQRKKIPIVVSVITDSVSIHRAWTAGKSDYYIVATTDSQTSLETYGVTPEKIKILGYPISSHFSEYFSRTHFLEKLKLSPDKKTILLILSDGMSWIKIRQIIRALKISRLRKIQLVIIDSTAKKLRHTQLKNYAWPFSVYISGWTDEMHHFIRSADIVLTKAGGSTIMECIHSGVPLIIIDVIPGHEVGNAFLVQKYNLGVVMPEKYSTIDDAVKYIFEHETHIKKNIITLQKPDAAADIAHFLMSLISSH